MPDCSSGEAPSGFVSNCSVSSEPVCSYASGTLRCDLSALDCTVSPALYAVNYASSDSISVFGTCKTAAGPNEHFCCFFDDPLGEVGLVELVGTDGDDERIAFTNNDGGVQTSLSTTGTQLLKATAFGRDGEDTLVGSKSTSTLYTETLYGEKEDDVIHCNEGDDVAYGGSGDDRIYGDAGEDTLYGQRGDDTLDGGRDDDWLHGGWDDDILRGGRGNDVLYGSRGADTMSGQRDNDVLCDTNLRNFDNSCPVSNAFYGNQGANKAWQNHLSLPPVAVCNSIAVVGNGTVNEARDPFWDWFGGNVVSDPTDVSSTTSAWPECSVIIGMGGH